MRTSAVCLVLVWAWFTAHAGAVATPRPADAINDAMPAVQQNALVQKYCVGCHKGATPGGGLSLEAFDASREDPGLARMIVTKISKDGAMAAAGVPKPDAPTMEAFLGALSTVAGRPTRGNGVWDVTLASEPKSGYTLVTARVEQAIATASKQAGVYQLTITCSGKSHRGDMQVATFTRHQGDGPVAVRPMSPQANGEVAFRYALDGGAPRSAALDGAEPHAGSPKEALPLPARTLAVIDLFANENVSFDFVRLNPAVRQQLATCFMPAATQ